MLYRGTWGREGGSFCFIPRAVSRWYLTNHLTPLDRGLFTWQAHTGWLIPHYKILKQRFLDFFMLHSFNTAPHTVVIPNPKITLLLFYNCKFATVIHHTINIWYTESLISDSCGRVVWLSKESRPTGWELLFYMERSFTKQPSETAMTGEIHLSAECMDLKSEVGASLTIWKKISHHHMEKMGSFLHSAELIIIWKR